MSKKPLKKKLKQYSKFHSRKHLRQYMVSAIEKYAMQDQKIISIGSGGEIKRILTECNVNFTEIDIDAEFEVKA